MAPPNSTLCYTKDNYDGTVDGWTWDWTYANALLFTLSIMTTVGYGHISPKSFSGQLFTIPYSLVGIALLMMFMTTIGEMMGHSLKIFYSRFFCRPCRVRR